MPTSEPGGDSRGVPPEQSKSEPDNSPSGDQPPGEHEPKNEPVTRALIVGLPPRSKWDQMRDWLTLGIASASLIGVGIAFYTLQATKSAAHEDDWRTRYAAISERGLDMDAMLINHPQSIPYFWPVDPKEAADEKALTTKAIATQRVDYDSYAYMQLTYMGTAPRDGKFAPSGSKPDDQFLSDHGESVEDDWDAWTSWSESIVGDFRNSPVMCKQVADAQALYDKLFVDALRKANACSDL